MSNIKSKKKFKIVEDNHQNEDNQQNELINNYINSLSELEKEALNIANRMLESSFNLEKSIGFKEYIKNKI